MRTSILLLTLAALGLSSHTAMAENSDPLTPSQTQNPDIRALFGGLLFAEAPRPECAEKLALFRPFIGSWDLDVVNYFDNPSPHHVSGEWHFGWALEGRAVADVWISPSLADRSGREEQGDYGVTLRFYDPEIDAIRTTWIGPVWKSVRLFIGRPVGDEIVMSGTRAPGVETRWILSKITTTSFHWRHLESTDGWVTNRLRQEIFATRQKPRSQPTP